MKSNLVRTIALFALLAVSNFATAAKAEDYLEEGKKMYCAKHFKEARNFFEMEIKINPKNATAHYLLGNVLLELKQNSDAQKEYQKADQLDPNSMAGQYSRLALSALLSKSSSATNAIIPSIPANYQSATTQVLPGSTLSTEKAATVKSARKISSEATGFTLQQQLECDAKVKHILAEANNEISRLKAEMQQRIADNGTPQYVQGYVRQWRGGVKEPLIKTYDPEPANQIIRDDYKIRIDNIEQKARQDADQLIQLYKQRQLALEDSALGLDKFYVNKNQTGNIMLNPSGTDIYNRNYQTGDTASGSPVPIMLAPAKSLSGAHSDNK